MTQLRVATQVKASLDEVRAAFTQELFTALNPPFPPVKLMRYDGNKPDDLVQLILGTGWLKQRWTSKITHTEASSTHWLFIDKGIELPFFLRFWEHSHEVYDKGNYRVITDYIQLEGPWWLPDFLLKLLFTGLMLYRRPIYRHFFGNHRR